MIVLTRKFSFLFLFKCSVLSPPPGVHKSSQIPVQVFHWPACLCVSLLKGNLGDHSRLRGRGVSSISQSLLTVKLQFTTTHLARKATRAGGAANCKDLEARPPLGTVSRIPEGLLARWGLSVKLTGRGQWDQGLSSRGTPVPVFPISSPSLSPAASTAPTLEPHTEEASEGSLKERSAATRHYLSARGDLPDCHQIVHPSIASAAHREELLSSKG